MNILRAEIKSHISGFSRLTNLNGMFRNMDILDYLDPDTFNNVDIADATTDEMFAGCTNLEVFEMPNDIVKPNVKVVYQVDGSDEIIDEPLEGTTAVNRYYNPFDSQMTLTDDSSVTYTYRKGLRQFGARMFNGCKNIKVFIKKLLAFNGRLDRIVIDQNAFYYNCYDPNTPNNNVRIIRPVILFEHDATDILQVQSESGEIQLSEAVGDVLAYPETGDGRYFVLNQYSLEKEVNLNNIYINFEGGNAWLREVYFGVNSVSVKETVENAGISTTTDQNTSVVVSYATTDEGNILFKLYSNPDLKKFNIRNPIIAQNAETDPDAGNPLNLISLTVGSIPLDNNTFPELKEISLVIPEYDSLDPLRPRFDFEKVVYPIFVNETNNKVLDIGSMSLGKSIDRIYITKSKVIPDHYFYKCGIKSVWFDYENIEKIEASAFEGC